MVCWNNKGNVNQMTKASTKRLTSTFNESWFHWICASYESLCLSLRKVLRNVCRNVWSTLKVLIILVWKRGHGSSYKNLIKAKFNKFTTVLCICLPLPGIKNHSNDPNHPWKYDGQKFKYSIHLLSGPCTQRNTNTSLDVWRRKHAFSHGFVSLGWKEFHS